MWVLQKFFRRVALASLVIGAVSWHASAQHAGHAPGAVEESDPDGIAAGTETLPANDSVLVEAPDDLRLNFPQQVRLVKLTLRSAQLDWVDISFRYDPRPNEHFVWQLPSLEESAYYLADWAVLSPDERLIRGSFKFAFGPDAQPPSVTQREQFIGLQPENGSSNIRTVSPPPSQIILDRDPPRFDPPFTIDLQNREPNR